MENAFFSVIIPVYNKKPHVKKCIESVLAQNYCDFEIIVIDDASTDGSMDILLSCYNNDERIKIYRRQKAGAGGYAARNMGMKKACGKWIAFLDADDEWTENHLLDMHRLITRYPEVSCAGAGWINMVSEDKEYEDIYYKKNVKNGDHLIQLTDFLENTISKKRPCYTSVFCVKNEKKGKRELFPEERANKGGDLYFFLRCVMKSGAMAWSSHIGAVHNMSAVNRVADTPFKSVELFLCLKEDCANEVTKEQEALIDKFVNRVLFNAWRRNKMLGYNVFSIYEVFNFKADMYFGLYVFVYSLIPKNLMHVLRGLRGSTSLAS